MSNEGNEEKALAAIAKLEAGANLAEVLAQHDLEFEIELFPGLTTMARPKIEEDGRAHLRGEVKSAEYGDFNFHIDGDPAKIEKGIRDAVENNLPLKLAAWWKNHFERSPILKRVLIDGTAPKKLGVIGPRRFLLRSF